MKSVFLCLLSAMTILSFSSCKKSSSNNNNPVNTDKSDWTFGGTYYKGTATATGTANGKFFISSGDSTDVAVGITFSTRPTANGAFTVVNTNTATPTIGAGQCGVNISNGGSLYYSSNGTAGNKVNVTIANGKMNATFTDVTLLDFFSSTTKKISGTLVEP